MSTKHAIRIAVADDEPVVLTALASLIGRQRDMDLVGAARDAAGLLELAARQGPDVVLTDLKMPGDVPAAIRAIDLLDDAPAIIVLSAYEEVTALYACIEAGAAAFVLKHVSAHDVLATVRDHARWRGALLEAGSWDHGP